MWGIAEFTLRKAKESAFIIMFILAVLAGFMLTDTTGNSLDKSFEATGLVGQLMSSREGYPILASSFSAIIFTLLLALFAGATDIPRDIESRMIMLMLSKPITRADYLIGKYIGLLALCSTIYITTQLAVYLGHYFSTGQFYPLGLMVKQFYLLLILLPFLSMIIMISCFVPDISAMVIGVLYVLFAISVSVVPILMALVTKDMERSVQTYIVESAFFILYYMFPNFIYYFQTFSTIGLIPLALLVYSISISTIFLTIGTIRLNTRDLI